MIYAYCWHPLVTVIHHLHVQWAWVELWYLFAFQWIVVKHGAVDHWIILSLSIVWLCFTPFITILCLVIIDICYDSAALNPLVHVILYPFVARSHEPYVLVHCACCTEQGPSVKPFWYYWQLACITLRLNYQFVSNETSHRNISS